MDEITPELTEVALSLWQQAQGLLSTALQPFRLYQLLGIVGILVLAWCLARIISPRFLDWVRAKEGLAKWQLRWAVILDRQLTLILFTVISWATVQVMLMITWPSRSQLIGIATTIATALLIITLTGKMIRNRSLRHMITFAAGVWAIAFILQLEDQLIVFLDHFALTVGDFRLSALTVIKALIVTGLLFLGARMATRGASNRIQKNEDISPSMRVLAIKVVQMVLFGGAFFIGLKAVGFDLTGLAVLSGAVGVGLGFGLQKVVSNLVSGIIILLDKSIKPGDVISLGDTFGWIEALGARYVSVVTRDGKEYLIPNEDLITGQVVNWSHSDRFVRLDLHFGTAYDDDPHQVRKLAIEAAHGVKRVLSTRAAVCHIVGFGDSSVDYVLRFWISDPTGGLTNIRGNVYLALWDTFKANGISIPFPQREVRMLGDGGKPAPDKAVLPD